MSWKPKIGDHKGPKYLALFTSLAADIRSGRLQPGYRLPSQRQIASDLKIDLTTVTRAFNEARKQGLIEASPRRGSFVRPSPNLYYYSSAHSDDSRIVNLSNNTPPQPVEAKLNEHIGNGIAAVFSSPQSLLHLDYQDSAGAADDRLAGASWLAPRVGDIPVERILVVGGAQTAISALLSSLLAVGDSVCAPVCTYPGLKAAASQRGVRLIPVATDEEGLVPAAFRECCERDRPAALYCVPTIDNPTTATLPLKRREEIARIAERFGVAIIEDDAYGPLPSQAIPPIAALAPTITWYIATLSKCVTPALRIAYVVAPGLSESLHLAAAVRAMIWMAPSLMAALVSRWIRDGILDEITRAVRRESVARQAIAREVLHGFGVHGHPEGHNVWLGLPGHWRQSDLLAYAGQQGLALVPSDAFAIGPAPDAIRLSLGAPQDRASLERGLKILAAVLSQRTPAVSGHVYL